MKITDNNREKPYQKISEANRTTGLSMYFLRQGCKNGTVPHVKSGNVYYIDVPGLLKQLGANEE